MKTATADLIALLNAAGGANPIYYWDFFTLTLVDGTQLRYGTANFTITADTSTIWNPQFADGSGDMWFAGISWPPGLMDAEGGVIGHWKAGLDADSFSLLYKPRAFDEITGDAYPDTINGVPWLQAARSGALDGADVIVSTAYYDTAPTGPIPYAGLSPVGTLVVTRGLMGAVDVDDTGVHMQVADYRTRLGRMMPRNLYQSGCRLRLYDTRCGLSAGTFTQSGVIASTSTSAKLVSVGAVPTPGGSDTYTLGTLTITSGDNNGFSRMVMKWNGAKNFTVLSPFPYPVVAGTTFDVSAGCDKRLSTCQAFSNEENFNGEPYVPLPEIAVG